MDVVAVTGSSGLVGRYVVERLIKCGRYKEIRLIDRIQRSCSGSDNVILRHFCIDINDEGALEQALHGCNAVVHCSHAPLPWTYSDKEASKAIWKDNLSATEMLVDKMVQMGVKSLVHVGDAYSALPIEDNYGLGEMVFNTYPADYILGEYGESRTRGEMYARKVTANGSSLKGVFLRPVHVHAEEASSSWRSLMRMAEHGSLPYIDGERRGMHQFIYAGNLAAIVDRCLGFLATNPDRVNTEIIYCLDDTYAIPIRQFLEQRVQSPRFSAKHEVSFEKSFLQHYLSHIKYSVGLEVSKETLSYPMFRFLFAKTIGFSDRKQRLLLDYIPELLASSDVKSKMTEPLDFERSHLLLEFTTCSYEYHHQRQCSALYICKKTPREFKDMLREVDDRCWIEDLTYIIFITVVNNKPFLLCM